MKGNEKNLYKIYMRIALIALLIIGIGVRFVKLIHYWYFLPFSVVMIVTVAMARKEYKKENDFCTPRDNIMLAIAICYFLILLYGFILTVI